MPKCLNSKKRVNKLCGMAGFLERGVGWVDFLGFVIIGFICAVY
jgi:hypothetical protein